MSLAEATDWQKASFVLFDTGTYPVFLEPLLELPQFFGRLFPVLEPLVETRS